MALCFIVPGSLYTLIITSRTRFLRAHLGQLESHHHRNNGVPKNCTGTKGQESTTTLFSYGTTDSFWNDFPFYHLDILHKNTSRSEVSITYPFAFTVVMGFSGFNKLMSHRIITVTHIRRHIGNFRTIFLRVLLKSSQVKYY